MSLPWFKFYPSAWRAEPSLRIVSLEARGLWIEMLCIMHEAEPCGQLLVRGVPIDAVSLAALTGAPEQTVRACLHELETAGVMSRNRDGVIVSRRMVRDAAKRAADKNNGKKGGNPSLKFPVGSNVYVLGVNPPLNPPDKPGVKAKRLDTRKEDEANASLSTLRADAERVFETLWKLWPSEARKRHPQDKVRAAILSQLKLGATATELVDAGKAHVADRLKSGPGYVKGLVPWLNQQLWRNWLPEIDWAERHRIRLEHGYWNDAAWGPPESAPGFPKTAGGNP